MQYEMSRKKLRHYFGNVTYIDNEFDTCLVKEPIVTDEFDDGGPPLPAPLPVGNGTEVETEETTIDLSGSNLRTLLDALNKEEYSDICLNPVVYSENSRDDQVCQQIIAAPLTIIDWELGPNKNGFDIIQQLLSMTNQLKVIVVYSASYMDAIRSLEAYPLLTASPYDTSKYEWINAYKCNNSSLMVVADKQHFNINTLLDIISELFINHHGIMPIALLDFMDTCQQQSDKLFKALSLPLSDLYNRQMHFSDKSDSDIAVSLTQFIQHNLLGTCTVHPDIIHDFFEYQKEQLKTYISSPDASTHLRHTIAKIQTVLSDEGKQFCDALIDVDFQVFKECTDKAILLGTDWQKVLERYSPYFKAAKKKYAEKKVQSILSPYESFQYPAGEKEKLLQHRAALVRDAEKSIEKSFADFKNHTLPVLIELLISTDQMLQKGSELVENMKYESYQNSSLYDLLRGGFDTSRGKLASFLFNKLHFGDILTKQTGDITEYLLCLTPPCDILRPDKTNFNIIFIHGSEVPSDQLMKERKQNCHLSVVPAHNGGAPTLRYVNWEFFKVVRFDLSIEADYQELYTWDRPFRMAESYTRQISNLFTAHFSRAGVDEIFMKSASNIRGLFIG